MSKTCTTCKKTKQSIVFKKTEHTNFKTCSDCRLYAKKYYKQNKTDILKQKYEKVTCECGSVVNKCNLSNHKRSNKHKRVLNGENKQ